MTRYKNGIYEWWEILSVVYPIELKKWFALTDPLVEVITLDVRMAAITLHLGKQEQQRDPAMGHKPS